MGTLFPVGRINVAAVSRPPWASQRLGTRRLVLLAGITSSILIDFGDIVWWKISWDWKLYLAFYHVSFWALAGLVLGRFVEPARETGGAHD